MSGPPSLGIRFKTSVPSELLIVGLLIALAAFTRLYLLGSFPSFPPQSPWLGDASQSACPAGMSGVFPGLYRDEMSRLCEIALFPHALTTYEPSLQIIFVKVSQYTLGQNYFADRLPSALASVLTSAIVYLAAKQLYKSKVAALVSGLYLVVMTPAVVYGRMIFYENLVGLMLTVSIYGIAKFENGGERKWLWMGAIAAAIAPFGKVDGTFVLVFFTIWALDGSERRKKILPLISAWAPVVAAGVVILSLVGTFQGVLSQWYFGLAGREQSLQFLFIQSMPSGYIGTGYIRPDFWYLFGLLSVGVLVIIGSRAGKLLTEVLFAFVSISFLSFGISAYYLIMLFPLFALAAGGAIKRLSEVGTTGAALFYAIFYAPLVGVYSGVAATYIGTNYSLFALNGLLFVAPATGWFVLEAVYRVAMNRRFPLALVVLACFFGLLILGTTVIYSYYFSLRSL